MARLIRKTRELPGQELFQYLDDAGDRHSVGSEEINSYLKQLTGENFTAKDFRTWGGTAQAVHYIINADVITDKKKLAVETCKHVASRLGNTPSVCKTHYIHPEILKMADEQPLLRDIAAKISKRKLHPSLHFEEHVLIEVLNRIRK